VEPIRRSDDKSTTTGGGRRNGISRRLPYAAPELKVFGAVGALTQAGTGLTAEMGMSMSTMQRL